MFSLYSICVIRDRNRLQEVELEAGIPSSGTYSDLKCACCCEDARFVVHLCDVERVHTGNIGVWAAKVIAGRRVRA
jgi:hypothetical protein